MSSTPFGEHLRREREMRGVSLDEIAAATRISTRFLEALEKEQWELLPGGAFNRGFIRSVARFLGIDEDGLVAEYAYERKNTDDVRVAVARSEEIPRNWRPIAAFGFGAALLVVAAAILFHHYGAALASRLHARFAGAAVSASSRPTPGPGTSVTAPDLDLAVQSSKAVDITVVADGQPAFTGTLQPIEAKPFEAHETLEIDCSDPSALTLVLNGHPLAWMVSSDHPQKMTLTRNDLPPAAEESH